METKLFDGYTIPYKNKTFDLVVLGHVIEHVEHPLIIKKQPELQNMFL